MSPTEPRRSIRVRLTLATVGLVGVVAALSLGGLYLGADFLIEKRADDSVERELRSLRDHHEGRGRDGLVAEILRRSAESGRTQGVYVFAEERYEMIVGNLPNWPEGVVGPAPAGDHSWEEGAGTLRTVRYARVASFVLEDGRHLLVGRDVTEQRNLQQVLAAAALGAFAFALVLAIAGGLAMGRSLLARVGGMNDTVLRILGGGGEERVPVGEPRDEFDDLAVHFNRLIEENEHLIARMREVTDDVAHDLRTPLSRMRGHIEASLAAPEDEARAREALHRLLDETNGVLDTFNALLSISQIQSGAARQQMERLDLEAVVRDAVDLYQPVAEEAGLDIETELGEGLSVTAARHLLAQAVLNLIDNAIKYSEGGGNIAVTTRRAADGIELEVADRGPGIAPEDRERVLQRFVRLDASRQRPGTGLGLSFVAAVARLHGASLRLEDNAPGLRVILAFPRA